MALSANTGNQEGHRGARGQTASPPPRAAALWRLPQGRISGALSQEACVLPASSHVEGPCGANGPPAACLAANLMFNFYVP